MNTGLQAAPVLGIPDYTQKCPLHFFERVSCASGILVQKHGLFFRPDTYYSSKLSPVVLGMPRCLRLVAAVAIMIDKSAPVVLASDCFVHVPNSVQHMTAACWSGNEAVILSSSHTTVKHSLPLNPATFLPHMHFEVDSNLIGL